MTLALVPSVRSRPVVEIPPPNPTGLKEAPPPPPLRREPVDIRLTSGLRSRALLRRDYEARSQRFSGLFAGGLPA